MRNLILILTLILLASCTKQEAMLSLDEQARTDSLALHVAVLPTWSSLPVFYAEKTGLWDSAKVAVHVMPFEAQMDIDTALINRHAAVATSDLIRALRLYDEQTPVKALLSVSEPLSLVAVKGKRVKQIHQLKERMIAISRLCITDYWCEQFIDSNGVARPDFYRPQVHNIKLRAEMLRTGLMDAALLPEPYSSWAVAAGNVLLRQTSEKDSRLAAWVIRKDAAESPLREEQLSRFMKAWEWAVEEINEGSRDDIVKTILHEEYGLPKEMADTLVFPTLDKGSKPSRDDIEKAVQWLRGKKRLPSRVTADSLLLQ